MTQGQRDGKNPKFRILCKCCNSYLHTIVGIVHDKIRVACTKCNVSDTLEEDI